MLEMLMRSTTGTRSDHFRSTVRAWTNSSGQWSLPARGKATLETFASVSPISMNRMIRFSTDHCWKKENFCRVA